MTKNRIVNLFAIASLSLASAALAQDAGAAPKNADAPAHKEKKEKGEKKAKEHKAVEVGEKVPDFNRRSPGWNSSSCCRRTTGMISWSVRMAPLPEAARTLGSSKKKPPWSGVWNSTHWRRPGTRRFGVGAP